MKGRIHLLCGKVATGKSHYSKTQAADGKAFLLSIDAMLIEIFGKQPGREVFELYEGKCKNWQQALAIQLASLGHEVYLDWGFWKKAERTACRNFFQSAGFKTILHFFDGKIEARMSLLEKRNSSVPSESFIIEAKDLEFFDSLFESPDPDENYEYHTADSKAIMTQT
jgi:predicted kinase